MLAGTTWTRWGWEDSRPRGHQVHLEAVTDRQTMNLRTREAEVGLDLTQCLEVEDMDLAEDSEEQEGVEVMEVVVDMVEALEEEEEVDLVEVEEEVLEEAGVEEHGVVGEVVGVLEGEGGLAEAGEDSNFTTSTYI